MAYLDDAIAHLEVFEGVVPWMYLDTKGFVTVAVGEMLPNALRAQSLGFVDVTGQPSTPASIAAEYERVLSLPMGKQAGFYRSQNSPVLPHPAIDALLKQHLASFDAALAGRFQNYSSFPDAAKLALLDMIYNLGISGLFSGYPKFLAMVTHLDWTHAAAACHRNGPSQARNDWTRQQFLTAAVPPSAPQGPA